MKKLNKNYKRTWAYKRSCKAWSKKKRKAALRELPIVYKIAKGSL